MNINKPKIPILLINYSRSGGTLISSILGQLDSTVLLSEVNPIKNADTNVRTQAKDWYGIDLKKTRYYESINELNSICIQKGKTLIIRDFSFVNFTPNVINGFEPTYQIESYKQLKGLPHLKTFAFVRDTYDIWISRGCPPQFSKHYLKYVKALIALKIPIIKYEDFCLNPEATLIQVGKILNLDVNLNVLSSPNKFTKITGDNQLENTSRGRKENGIRVLKRVTLPYFLSKRALNDLDMKTANELLGYETNFTPMRSKNIISKIKLESKWMIKRILKRWPTHEC